MDELKELWAVLSALPGQVWLDALYLFVIVGVLKAVGVVPKNGAAAAANALIAIFMNGGLGGISELSGVLQTSGVAVIGAVYYLLWKSYIGPFLGGLVEKIKDKLPSKA